MKRERLLCRLSPANRRRDKQSEAKCSNKDASGTVVSINRIVTSKRSALRRGIWFRALNLVERGILDLTTRYVANIKSTKLATVVTAILEKLKLASESIVDRLTRSIGFSLAKKIGEIALNLGNRLAGSWGKDAEFARYLAVAHLNSSGTHKF